MFKLVADALLGVLIEDVNSRSVDSNGDVVACLSSGAGRNSCDNVLVVGSILHALKSEVELNLSAHPRKNSVWLGLVV